MSVTPENSTCLIRLPEVKQRTGLSRSSVNEKIRVANFPSPSISACGRRLAGPRD